LSRRELKPADSAAFNAGRDRRADGDAAWTPARLETAPIEQAEEGEVVDAVPKEK
jgi:hypothetical protein